MTVLDGRIQSTVEIFGPSEVCEGIPVTYDTESGYEEYRWTLNGEPAGDTQSITLASLTAGLHLVEVVVSNGGQIVGSGSLVVTASPALSDVRIESSGSTVVCETCSGGTVSVSNTGGGAATEAWGFRTLPSGPITTIPGETGNDYVIDGNDFPGTGMYFLVATTTPSCGSVTVSNELEVTVFARRTSTC